MDSSILDALLAEATTSSSKSRASWYAGLEGDEKEFVDGLIEHYRKHPKKDIPCRAIGEILLREWGDDVHRATLSRTIRKQGRT